MNSRDREETEAIDSAIQFVISILDVHPITELRDMMLTQLAGSDIQVTDDIHEEFEQAILAWLQENRML